MESLGSIGEARPKQLIKLVLQWILGVVSYLRSLYNDLLECLLLLSGTSGKGSFFIYPGRLSSLRFTLAIEPS